MSPTVLHVLSQRPSLTGSGITLDALVAGMAGRWLQHVVVGSNAGDPHPDLAGLPAEHLHPLVFGSAPVTFPLPGMSDVMPYKSTVFSGMSKGQLTNYRTAWKHHLTPILEAVSPDIIHCHHIWILGSLIKDLAPRVPLVLHCHATGLRQAALCPHLARQVRRGCAKADRFATLHEGHADELASALGVDRAKIGVVGAGYREDLFHSRGRSSAGSTNIVYVGKYSDAKGLPWLLDALEILRHHRPEITLHVAGGGAGSEADEILRRMRALAPWVVLHGQLSQPELAHLLRQCHLCVLPSFFEGVPLVLVEALACGCRLVATRLPGVERNLAPHLGPWMELVDLPRLLEVDHPEPADTPAFVQRLASAMEISLLRPPADPPADVLAPFTWAPVIEKTQAIWHELLAGPPPRGDLRGNAHK